MLLLFLVFVQFSTSVSVDTQSIQEFNELEPVETILHQADSVAAKNETSVEGAE
jgi:hypothetical protein